MKTDCLVKDCARPAEARALCHAHYMRLWFTGDVRADSALRPYSRDPEYRFFNRVDRNGPTPIARPELGPCWVWTGPRTKGYGRMSVGGKEQYVHRWAYERFVGQLPDGLDVDHLCRNPSCVNFAHLEPVTHQVNCLRGESPCAKYARRDTCAKGHAYTAENTFTRPDKSRGCRTCDRARSRASYLKRRARKELVA
jgi:HNH endonuclease